jgi:NADH-quinone oxidoreductase subunit C
MDHAEKTVASLRTRLGEKVLAVDVFRGETTIEVVREGIVEACRLLRETSDLDYAYLAALTAADRWPEEPRFSIVYRLYSLSSNAFIGLRVRLEGQSPELASIVSVFPAADWHEREIFDMFGITFVGHPDLRRLLMPHDWVGHPLRKDQPLGYEEVQFTFNFDEIDRRKPYARE